LTRCLPEVWCRAVLLIVCGLVLSGCVTPATGNDSYRGKAFLSVQAATSEVATTRITVDAYLRHRVFTTTADETITANEKALGSISGAFDSVQPPPGSDAVRDSVSQQLSDAEDAVSAARIALRRSDKKDLLKSLAGLAKVLDDLDATEKRLG
jgi:hypothetical protein